MFVTVVLCQIQIISLPVVAMQRKWMENLKKYETELQLHVRNIIVAIQLYLLAFSACFIDNINSFMQGNKPQMCVSDAQLLRPFF